VKNREHIVEPSLINWILTWITKPSIFSKLPLCKHEQN